MPYSWKEYIDKTNMMNKLYGSFCDAVVELPMSPDFPVKNTIYTDIDRVHYTAKFSKNLMQMVDTAVKKLI